MNAQFRADKVPSSLDNKVIAFVESRMSSQLGSLITRHGGTPYPAPVLQEIYSKDDPQVHQIVHDMCSGNLDAIVLQTGVGTAALIETSNLMGLEDEFLSALDRTTVIARSPKPASVLRKNKIHIDIMPPEPYTTKDLIASLPNTPLTGKKIVIQQYGAPNSLLSQELSNRGANVSEVSLYSWGLPEDEIPVVNMINDIANGQIDVLAFTSQPQVPNLLDIADKHQSKDSLISDLSGQIVVASVGPVCTKRLNDLGISVDVEPEHPHMGSMIIAIAEYFTD